MKWKIKTTFYTQKSIGSGKYEFPILCDGEIFGKNIWISKSVNLPEVDGNILNFEYVYNETYSRISNKTVNTHFRYFIHTINNAPKLSLTKIFAKLSWWQRQKLKIIMEETGWQRNPIEFGLLLIALFSLIASVVISCITLFNQRANQKAILQNMNKMQLQVLQSIQNKPLNIHLFDIPLEDTIIVGEENKIE